MRSETFTLSLLTAALLKGVRLGGFAPVTLLILALLLSRTAHPDEMMTPGRLRLASGGKSSPSRRA